MQPEPERGAPQEWLSRAKGSLRIAKRYEPGDYFEDLCFNCQQAVEKALKAVLIQNNIGIIKTHDIVLLLELLPININYPIDLQEASEITSYAVFTRYPGEYEPVSESDWKHALEIAKKVVNWAHEIIKK